MLTAISAPPGSGKSLYCIQIIEETVRKNPNRMIFTNIIGINIPGVLPIVSTSSKPFDWRDLPDGALIVYDEAHEHPAFAKTDLLKNYSLPNYINDLYDSEVAKVLDYENLPTQLKHDFLLKHNHVFTELPLTLKVKEQEQIIQKIRLLQKAHLERAKEDILDIGRALTMHRHFGFDIVLVTQKPDLLNSFVKAATSEHLILRRLFQFNLSIIYSFSEIQDHFGNATRKNALSTKIWFFPKRLFKYYISAEAHTAKGSLPLGLKAAFFGLGALICFSVYRGFSGDFSFFHAAESAENTPIQSPVQEVASGQKQIKAEDKKQIQDLSNICRQAVNVETPECKKWFDDLSKNGGSLGEITTFKYDGSKPFDVEYTPIDLEPKDFPRFKNAVVYNGKCTAYSQQGTIMHKVSSKDCFRLASGDRPFDYFAEQRSYQPYQNNSDDSGYKKALYEENQRLNAEKMLAMQNAEVRVDQVPLGEPKSKYFDDAANRF